MVSLEEARAIISAHATLLGAVVTPLANAHGRVLREEVAAPDDFPAFDRAAMDGYAVAMDDPSESFKVLAEVRAGQVPAFKIRTGECARVFTGAQLPAGASQVLMQEKVRVEGDTIFPLERSSIAHVRQRGEDVKAGDVLLRAGTRLRATEMALLAQVGEIEPTVTPSPRVVHLVSGDELVPPGGQPGPGQIRDSNSILIASLLADAGARMAHQRRCGEQVPAVTREAKSIPEAAWDLLLISGGASVGDYDSGYEALLKLGFHVHFREVNLRPGKPLIFATRRRQLAFVIPGNPVSHFVTFHLAIRHALDCMEGAEQSFPLVDVELATPLPPAESDRETFWPARVAAENGRLIVRPLTWRSSGDLSGIASANVLVQVLPGSEAKKAGDAVKCLLLEHR